MTKKNQKNGLFKYIPLFVFIVIILAVISVIIHIMFRNSVAFSDYFNMNVSSAVRAILAHATSWIPFSFAEGIIIFLPFLLIFLFIKSFSIISGSTASTVRVISGLLCIPMLLYVIFVFGFASGYSGSYIDKKLNIERHDLSADELENCAVMLNIQLEKLQSEIVYDENGFSVMNYSYNEMSEKLICAYDKLHEKYSFIQKLDSRIKPVMLSEPWTYTHISGMYSYFTGEANVNTNYPDFIIPYTAAHELAHQRGIARENEANFIAFLVCIESDDPYIQYSGYLNMYQYVASALNKANPNLYSEMSSNVKAAVRGELYAYSKFFKKYEKSTASKVSGTINDTYLKIQGTEGSKSYGMVVDLAVVYINEYSDK